MDKTRVTWIDICKGIGILSVVYAHGLAGDSIRFIFYAFHLPLFFFLSGAVYHYKNHESIVVSFRKALKRVLLPYFLFAGISYIIWLLLRGNPAPVPPASTLQHMLGILYGSGATGQLFYNVVLWFLPCLFATRMLFALILHLTTKKRLLISILVMSAVAGYLFSVSFPKTKLPFSIEVAFSAVAFFGAGYLWNAFTHTKHYQLLIKYAAPVFALSFTLLLVFAIINFDLSNQQIDMRLNRFSNVFLFYSGAFSGILSCIMLSVMIRKNSLLQYLGKNSMPIFVWHLILFSIFSKILFIFTDAETVKALRNLYLAPLYTVLSIVCISALTFVLKVPKRAYSRLTAD